MAYTFTHPKPDDLESFIGVNNPDADVAYARILEQVGRGEYDLAQRWLLTSAKGALAALVRAPVPRPIYRLRTSPDLNDEDALALLEFAANLRERDEPATLNYNSATSRDLSALALAQGWTLEAHVKGFDTDLRERDDLRADPAAQTFALSHLLTDAFAAFYTPI